MRTYTEDELKLVALACRSAPLEMCFVANATGETLIEGARRVLQKVPLPWAEGFLTLDPHGIFTPRLVHRACFQRMGDEAVQHGRERPSWVDYDLTWDQAATCHRCNQITPPKEDR